MWRSKIYTVESVAAGHPDKICDQISDAVLDECLRADPLSRVAVETFGSHGLIVVGGEVTTQAWVDIPNLVSKLMNQIGYPEHIGVVSNIIGQSPEIARGVDTGGAGDQGIMYGYATDETPEFMPKGVVLVHQLAQKLGELRSQAILPWLRPDGKTQITMENGNVKKILVSCQHTADVSQQIIRDELMAKLLQPVVGDLGDAEILINPTGAFTQGGFDADTGLTGRKIIADTYGGLVPHGGGCFSGKDATKVDRSAAYMARFAAKSIVAAGLAKECLVSVAYAIGRAEPVMLEAINEKGESLSEVVRNHFDFRPEAIIDRLNLRRPIYQPTAVYGHFGRPGFPWEEITAL